MSTFRNLLLDLERTGQVIGLMTALEESLVCGRVLRVGADYLIFETRSWSNGEVLGMRALPMEVVQGVELRPAADWRAAATGADFVVADDDDGEEARVA